MDPICPQCKRTLDAKNDINIEEIEGGIGDKGYGVAIVYCEKCQYPIGTVPSKKWMMSLLNELKVKK